MAVDVSQVTASGVWQAMLDDASDVAWFVVSPSAPSGPQAAVMQVSGKGHGGLDEVHEALRDDLVQYGCIRVAALDETGDRTSRRIRIVGFCWSGPKVGVMARARGLERQPAVMALFPTTHVTVQIFEREAFTEAFITAKLRSSSGAHQAKTFVFGRGDAASRVVEDIPAPLVSPTSAPWSPPHRTHALPVPAAGAAPPPPPSSRGATEAAAPAAAAAAEDSKDAATGRRRASAGTIAAASAARNKKKNRQAIFGGEDSESDGDEPEEEPGEPPNLETPATATALNAALSHYMFNHLNEKQRPMMIAKWRLRNLAAGTTIITQGDLGDAVYVLEAGNVEVFIDGVKVFQTDRCGFLFGELALLYNARRNASVIASTDVRIWALRAKVYKRTLVKWSQDAQSERVAWLSGVRLLQGMPQNVVQRAAMVMKRVVYPPGSFIITQGDKGNTFYVVQEGKVECRVNGVGVVATLGKGDYFGEMALLRDTPRTANIVAIEDTTCLELDRKPFEALLGQLQALMDEVATRRQQEIDDARAAAEAQGGGAAAGDAPAAAAAAPAAERPKSTTIGETPSIAIDSESGSVSKPFDIAEVERIGILGEGSFGVVRMVRYHEELFALKRLWKMEIKMARQVAHVMRECRVLASLSSPFIINLQGTSQDEDSLFMLLELVQGGELWSLLYNEKSPLTGGQGGMEDIVARFYVANVVAALGYLHERGVAYRDLKPENLLVASDGYLKLCDLGFAKSIPFKKEGESHAQSYTMLGSPDYLSPETILHKGHDKSVDLWSLGALIYELLVGATPFQAANQNKAFERACKRDLVWPEGFVEAHPQAADLIDRLIQVEPTARLGAGRNGMAEVQAHPWFEGLDWSALYAHTIEAPYKPPLASATDRSNFEMAGDDDGAEEYEEDVVPFDGDPDLFAGF